jgi:hypothetical protein
MLPAFITYLPNLTSSLCDAPHPIVVDLILILRSQELASQISPVHQMSPPPAPPSVAAASGCLAHTRVPLEDPCEAAIKVTRAYVDGICITLSPCTCCTIRHHPDGLEITFMVGAWLCAHA